MTGENNLLIVILGPTAVGKTGLAIQMAQELNGEIVGADSRQIYRHMDTGTAKPTAHEQQQAPHHLIDVVEPDDHLSLALYQKLAYAAIDDIHGRGCLPLLVGGTGLYITAVTEGWSIPRVAPNEALRAELETYAAEHGAPVLHTRLQKLDPDAAANIHPNNVRRLVRALEVCIESGQLFSELQRKKPPPYRIITHGLTMERERLYERADKRVDAMMDAGFLDEVQGLLDMGYTASLPSMSGLGYAQLAAHLAGELTLDEAITRTKFATHNFIRRQYSWFKGHDNGILWHNVEDMDVTTFFGSCAHRIQEQN